MFEYHVAKMCVSVVVEICSDPCIQAFNAGDYVIGLISNGNSYWITLIPTYLQQAVSFHMV